MLTGRVLLATNLDSGINVENRLFFSILDVQEVFDCLFFVFLDVTIK